MYITTRDIAGGTFMTCDDCGDAISMNKICENPIQSATDTLKHMAAHNASRAFAPVGHDMRPEPEAIPSSELTPGLSGIPAPLDRFDAPVTQLSPLPPEC
jgi:hypothetical protein